MSGAWWTKTVILAVAILASIVALAPTLYPVDRDSPDTWPGWYAWLEERVPARITPGLDLQGGLHLQYQVDVDKAVSDKLDRFAAELEAAVLEDHPDARIELQRVEDAPALIASGEGDVRALLDDDQLSLMHLMPSVSPTGAVRLDMDPVYIDQTRQYAIDQAIETIRRRVDALGVAEPSIARRGDTDLIVQLPGLSEEQFEEAKELISTTAQLEFQMVSAQDASFWPGVDVPPGTEGVTVVGGRPESPDLDALKAFVRTLDPPNGLEVAYLETKEFDPQTGELSSARYQPMLLDAEAPLTGEYITSAQVATDPRDNRPFVSLTFDAEGAQIFSDLTAAHVGDRMAIVLDDVITSAPSINERIPGGRCQITMGRGGSYNETFRQSERLVIALRNGALPAPIEKQFETQVGPTLGADSVRAGAVSAAVGFILVFGFMIFYYRGSGLIANLALLLNLLFLLAMLAMFRATLTLPGIAGITLTVGMAVDANIIILERIKEELRLGKQLRAAVSAGYDKAFTAILDSNVTTAIAGVILLQYGSGPVRGFAVTLLIGILATMYAAVVVTRLIYDYLLDAAKVSRISL